MNKYDFDQDLSGYVLGAVAAFQSEGGSKEQEELPFVKWIEGWDAASRFRLGLEQLRSKVRAVREELSERGPRAAFESSLHPPSVSLLGHGLRGLDGHLMSQWNAWCATQLWPTTEATLLPRALIDGHDWPDAQETAFTRLGEWEEVAKTLKASKKDLQDCRRELADTMETLNREIRRLGTGTRTTLLGKSRAPSGDQPEIVGAFPLNERLLLWADAPEQRLRELRHFREGHLPRLLASELEALPENPAERDQAFERSFGEAADLGLKRGMILDHLTEDRREMATVWLAGRDREHYRALMERAVEIRNRLKPEEVGGRLLFVRFAEGMDALAEAVALRLKEGLPQAAEEEETREAFDQWRKQFFRLVSLVRLEETASRESDRLRRENLSLKTDEELQELAGEISQRRLEFQAARQAVRDVFVDKKNRSKKELKGEALDGLAGMVAKEIGRRKFLRLTKVAAVVVGVLGLVLLIKGARDACEFGESRALEVTALMKSRQVIPVEQALANFEADGSYGGLARWCPSWREAEGDAVAWVASERAKAEAFDALVARLPSWHGEVEGAADTSSLSGKPEGDEPPVCRWGREFETGTEMRSSVALDLGEVSAQVFDKEMAAWNGFIEGRKSAATKKMQDAVAAFQKVLEEGAAIRKNPALGPLLERIGNSVATLQQSKGPEPEKDEATLCAVEQAMLAPEEVRDALSTTLKAAEELQRTLTEHLAWEKALRESTGKASYLIELGRQPKLTPEAMRCLPDGVEFLAAPVIEAISDREIFELAFGGTVFTLASAAARVAPSIPPDGGKEESALLVELNDDWMLRDILIYGRTGAVTAYGRGEVETRPDPASPARTLQTGDFYIPQNSPEAVKFVTRRSTSTRFGNGASTVTGDSMPQTRGILAPECSFFQDLIKVHLNTDTGQIKQPLLSFLEAVVRKQGINPLFKAFLQMKVGEALLKRPDAWGLDWTTFPDDLQKLKDLRLGGLALALDSGDWMVPGLNAKWGTLLTRYYAELEDTSYVGQFKKVAQLLSQVKSDSFAFVGYVDPSGQLALRNAAVPGNDLWGLRRSQKGNGLEAAVVFRNNGEGVYSEVDRPVPLSPVFSGSEAIARLREEALKDPVLQRYFR